VARLVADTGIDEGTVYPLSRTATTVGRSPDNQIQVIDKRTSRRHAEFVFQGGHYVVRDLESRNGTLVNDIPLKDAQPLQHGDRVLIGETTLVFERDADDEISTATGTTSVRLVPNLAWGQEADAMEAGVAELGPPQSAEGLEGEEETDSGATKRLRIVYELADALRSHLETEPLLETIMASVFNLLRPDRAFIMLSDPQSGELYPGATRLAEGQPDEIAVSRTIVDRCLAERVSLLVSDALSDVRFKRSESVVIQNIRSAICAPMICRDSILGVIYLDTKARASAYERAELQLATGIANQAAISLSNNRLHEQIIAHKTFEREMEIARDIQTRLLPRSMPKVENFEFSAMSMPAKQVGGDYYDLLELPDGRTGIALADVSGKGVPAAILTASVRSALKAEIRREGATVCEVLENLSELVFNDTSSSMYVTMVYCILNADHATLEYSNAGHPYPLLFSHDGELSELEAGGCFLGISEVASFTRGHATIPPGATLILYSDGVTDSLSPEEEIYGVQRLIDVIRKNLSVSPNKLREVIYQDTLDFRQGAEQFDDFTLIVVRNTQEP
jgi:sigma-B regulation protein RsbU (phosphoserine phosphatase)